MPTHDPAEKDTLLLKMKANDYRTLALIIDLITSNHFSPHETLALIKFILDRYPHPLDNIPLTYLSILQVRTSEP